MTPVLLVLAVLAQRPTLQSFTRDGAAVPKASIHVRRVALGITEYSIAATKQSDWEFRFQERAPVFGFGERYNALDQTGQVIVNRSSDTPGPKGTATYVPMPFFMSLSGYGLWLDTYAEASFDVGKTTPGEIVVRFHDSRLRILIFEGPGFPKILERFTGMVGRTKLPPYWAFGPWKSRNWHPDMAAVYEDVDRYRSLGIPGDVLVLDSPWATNYNTFVMNRLQFTDPEAMIQHVHDQGFKLCLWLTAFINMETIRAPEPELVGKIPETEASNYEEAAKNGYFLKDSTGGVYLATWWKGKGGLIDFSNPAAVSWWQGQVRQAVAIGADAFKADGGEGSFIAYPESLRTRYSVLYNQALEHLIDADLHGDGVLFSRSGSVGSHDLPFIWAGDNQADFSKDNGLPSVVAAGLNAGLSGVSMWTSDIGGYEKTERTPGDDTVFVRWTEFSAFSPVMEVHSSINLGPWDYGDEALDIFRRYSRLHMSLFPYRYRAAQESHRTGMPLMRALVLEFPTDSVARTIADEYEFGPDLLVAPVVTPGRSRAIHIPRGEWIDYWSGASISGPRDTTVDVRLDRIPLLVRAGAILPKIPEDVMTLVPKLDDRRVFEIYPGPGESLVDFEGRHLLSSPRHLHITGKPARVTIAWRFKGPTRVRLNGKAIAVDSGTVTFSHRGQSDLNW